MHGAADTAVPTGQSQILYDALKAHGVKAEIEFVPGANHIFAGATDAQGKMILEKVLPSSTEPLERSHRNKLASLQTALSA